MIIFNCTSDLSGNCWSSAPFLDHLTLLTLYHIPKAMKESHNSQAGEQLWGHQAVSDPHPVTQPRHRVPHPRTPPGMGPHELAPPWTSLPHWNLEQPIPPAPRLKAFKREEREKKERKRNIKQFPSALHRAKIATVLLLKPLMALILFPPEIYVKKITSLLTFAFHFCPFPCPTFHLGREKELLISRTISDLWRARSPSGWWSNLSSRHLSITGADASLPWCHCWTDLSAPKGGLWAPHPSVIFISASSSSTLHLQHHCFYFLGIFFKQNLWMKMHISNPASYVTLFSALFYDEVILVFMKGNNG